MQRIEEKSINLNIENHPYIKMDIIYTRENFPIAQLSVIQLEINQVFLTNILTQLITFLAFTKSTIQLLPSPYASDCLDYPNDYSTSDHTCYFKCLAEEELKQFNCVSMSYTPLETFIKQLNLSIDRVDNFPGCISTGDVIAKMYNKCNSKCKTNCNQNNFKALFTYTGLNIPDTARIYLFPTEKPFIKYISVPKMDIDRLLYELGGIIGLWFGLFAYSFCMKSIIMKRELSVENFKLVWHSWCKILFYFDQEARKEKI
jgi:hypothetical protein